MTRQYINDSEKRVEKAIGCWILFGVKRTNAAVSISTKASIVAFVRGFVVLRRTERFLHKLLTANRHLEDDSIFGKRRTVDSWMTNIRLIVRNNNSLLVEWYFKRNLLVNVRIKIFKITRMVEWSRQEHCTLIEHVLKICVRFFASAANNIRGCETQFQTYQTCRSNC